jgi:GNAT superfamily N-acetyltransferase
VADPELVSAETVQLMQGLAQRVTAVRPDLVNSDATYGELAWIWGHGRAADGATWPCRLWSPGGELAAWAWAYLPHEVRRSDGSVRQVTGTYLGYQVDPGQAGLVDEVIDWYDWVAAGLERTVMPRQADTFALARWRAHGYQTDPASLGDTGSWTELNQRSLAEIEEPVLPAGFRFLDACSAGPEAAVQAHVDAWAPSSYTTAAYADVRATAAYRCDLHVLIEAPDGTMAASAIAWLDPVNRTAEFEPVGTHPGYRRLGLGVALLLRGMHLARAAGAGQMTVACLGAPGHPGARGLYSRVGFQPFTRDAPLLKPAASADR